MIAFFLAGLIFVVTLLWCGLIIFAAGMSDAPSVDNDVSPMPWFVGGTTLAVLVALSHWCPLFHSGW
jgi:hypothetical protein